MSIFLRSGINWQYANSLKYNIGVTGGGPEYLTQNLDYYFNAGIIENNTSTNFYSQVSMDDYFTMSGSTYNSMQDDAHYSFDGVNDYGITNTASGIDGALTVCGWFRFGASGNIYPANEYGSTTNSKKWVMGQRLNGSNYYPSSNIYSGGSFLITYGTTILSTNTWYFICFTFNPGVEVKVYLNGVLEGTNATSLTTTNSGSPGISLGRLQTSSSFVYYDCDVAQLLMYSRVLTSNEILYNFNQALNSFGY